MINPSLFKPLICAALFGSGTATLFAAKIPGLYNTGVDDSGVVLPVRSTDPHYVVLETGTQAVLINNGAEDSTVYVANNSDSRWIWQEFTGEPGGVVRTFRLTFDLTGLDPSTASIAGRWTSDNNGLDILVNGQSTGQTSDLDAFRRWYNFTIPNQFLLGTINTIDFKVNEAGYPGGFRAEFLEGTADPTFQAVPDLGSSIGFACLSWAGLILVRRPGRVD